MVAVLPGSVIILRSLMKADGDASLFSKYKKTAIPAPFGPPTNPSETEALKRLARRLGYHMQRVIVVARMPEGWIAAYSTMASTDWPHVFPRPLAFTDKVRSIERMIEAFEPKGPNDEEDRQVRRLADQLAEEDSEMDYVFVAHRETGYEITLVQYDGALVEELPGQSFEDAVNWLRARLPDPGWPTFDDTYIGTGRDYGGYR